MVKSFYKTYFITLLIIVGVVFFNNYLSGNFLQNLVYKIVRKPVGYLNYNLLDFPKYTSGFLKTKEVVDENTKLKEENNILRGQLAELDSLKRENNFLRDELGVARRLNSPLLLAQIFNIQRSTLASTALINKGARDGVEKRMPLIAAGNILVGVVEQVFDESALVLLIDDPRVKISGRVLESRILVETKGELQNNLGLNLVANSDEINEGETIVTSGLDGLSEAMLVARVIKVKTPSGALFKTVSARPFFDPSLGSSLFVILK